jgi:phosphoglycolate phosphatase-like HAD superfamily hydrolase
VAIAVLTGFEEEAGLRAAKPDHVLDDLTQLFDIL